jgi:membrane-anchored glycerophosphoryl diester phosphodiesterase (GDPDase)
VSDDQQQWQAPGGSNAAVPPVPPPTPGYYGPVDGPGTPQLPGGTGWTPAPRPGLIPLRPIDFGTLLGASFQLLRRNPKPTFGAALLIQTIASVLSVAIIAAITFFAVARAASSTSSDLDTIDAGNIGLIVVGVLVTVALSVVASALLQGVIVIEVTRQTLGEKSTFRQLWVRIKGRVWALAGWSVLLSLAMLVVIGLLAGIIALLVVTLGNVGIVIGVLLGIAGGLAIAVVFAWIGTKLSLVPSAISIERLGIGAAIRRSWTLTNGSFWKTFGIELLVLVILNIATQVVSLPLSLVSGIVGGLADPNGQGMATTAVILIVVSLLTLAVTLVLTAITVVVQSGSTALIYLDLRIRKEALDLELIRYTEARQSGDGTVPDPFPGPATV